MHRDFVKYLRPDGNGIDYSYLEDYDTRSKLEDYLVSQHPVVEKHFNSCMAAKDKSYCQFW